MHWQKMLLFLARFVIQLPLTDAFALITEHVHASREKCPRHDSDR